ncbi:hypothetical protein AAHZ94_16140 [Streptomyces sp. HSW2009]|uniref:hypothetical protein n=1 Tax=Streptomyces sp. HSW2009 TaxID=3142890 RepID=UPI0032EB6086
MSSSRKLCVALLFAAALSAGTVSTAVADGHPDSVVLKVQDGHPDAGTVAPMDGHPDAVLN